MSLCAVSAVACLAGICVIGGAVCALLAAGVVVWVDVFRMERASGGEGV